MPDGRPLKERRLKNQQRLDVWVSRALKRDVKRIAGYERRPLSRVCAGLIRLGVRQYFDEADDAKLEPLRAVMRDLLGDEDDPFPQRPLKTRTLNRIEFDAAIDEGLRTFARRSGNP